MIFLIISSFSFSTRDDLAGVGLADLLGQGLDVGRFFEHVGGAQLHRLHPLLDRGVAGEQDHLQIRVDRLESLQGLQTVHFRHLQVEDNGVVRFLFHQGKGVPGRAGGGDVDVAGLHALAHDLEELLLVIDQQYSFAHSILLALRSGLFGSGWSADPSDRQAQQQCIPGRGHAELRLQFGQ